MRFVIDGHNGKGLTVSVSDGEQVLASVPADDMDSAKALLKGLAANGWRDLVDALIAPANAPAKPKRAAKKKGG